MDLKRASTNCKNRKNYLVANTTPTNPSPTNWRSTCCAWSRRNATRPTTSAARPTAGTHDSEAAPYIKPKLNTAPYNLGSLHDSRHDPEAALYNLGSPPDSWHDPEAALSISQSSA